MLTKSHFWLAVESLARDKRQLACGHPGGVVLQIGEEVAVGIGGHGHGRVSEHALRLLQAETFGQEPRGEEVAQGVEAVLGAPDRLARAGIDGVSYGAGLRSPKECCSRISLHLIL